MLRVEELTKPKKCVKSPFKGTKPIIVTKYQEVETIEGNKRITERVAKKVNITKMINESAKMIKKDQTRILLNEMEKLLTEREGKK